MVYILKEVENLLSHYPIPNNFEMNKKVLIFCPHPDDECLGLGGTIAKYIKSDFAIKICFISGHLLLCIIKMILKK